MQLIYFWVEEYKCLKDFEINLSSQYRIHYDKKQNKLNIEETPDKHDLFKNITSEYECINDLITIVGNNGVGKTTIIRFLTDIYFMVNTNSIIIYLDENQLHCCSGIKNINDNFGFKLEKAQASILPQYLLTDNLFKDYFTIFYSSVFDGFVKQESIKSNLLNITTNIKLYYNYNLKEYKYNFIDDCVKLLKTKDRLCSKLIKKMKFEFITFDKYNFLNKADDNLYLTMTYIECNKKSTKESKIIKENRIYIFLLTHISRIFEVYSEKTEKLFTEQDYPKLSEKMSIKKIISYLNELKNFQCFKQEFKTIDDIINIYNFLSKEENCDENAIIPLDKVEELNKLIENSSEIVQESIELNLYNLSSGEVALINMYSRFYSLIYDGEIKDENKEITIIIDECDAYLHPEWQRSFIKDFFQMCKDLFQDKKINVILTTHSPIVLSDIPKDNVRFLDKDESGQVFVKDENINTFGANIYNLYKNAFFLNNDGISVMGTLAHDKIKWIKENIHKLKQKINEKVQFNKMDYETLDKCKSIVAIIGEDVFKGNLQYEIDYIDEKMNSSYKDKKLEDLKQEYINLNLNQKESFIKYIIDMNKD